MQDLRNKLLKAGLVDKKQARKSKTDQRRARKKKGARVVKQEQQQRQEQYQQKKEQQAVEARARQQELNQARAAEELEHQVNDLIQANTVQRWGGKGRPFYFIGQRRRVLRITPSFEVADQLVRGQLAIVTQAEQDGRDFCIIAASAAQRVEQLAPGRLLFWNKPGQGQGDLPSYGAA